MEGDPEASIRASRLTTTDFENEKNAVYEEMNSPYGGFIKSNTKRKNTRRKNTKRKNTRRKNTRRKNTKRKKI